MKKILAVLFLMTAAVIMAGCIGDTPDGNVTSPTPAPTETPSAAAPSSGSSAPEISLSNADPSASYELSESLVNFAQNGGSDFEYLYSKNTDLGSEFSEFGLNMSGIEGGYVSSAGKNFYIYVYNAGTPAEADKAISEITEYYRSVYSTLSDLRTVRINGHDVLEVTDVTNRATQSEKSIYIWSSGNLVVIIDGNAGTEDLQKELAEKSGY